MNRLSEKFFEVLIAIIPIVFIVFTLKVTFIPIENLQMIKFFVGSLFVLVGLTFFLLGVDLGIAPLGVWLSSIITKKNRLEIVIISAFFLGFIISIAEPGLLILGNQIDSITQGGISSFSIVFTVSLGIGLFMIIGFMRLIYNIPLYLILIISYGVIFVLGFFTSAEFLAIAFDTSGSTTGVLAVPFILALSLGVSVLKKDSAASENDSFGLISIVSVGAIIAVMVLNLFRGQQEYTEVLATVDPSSISVFRTFINSFLKAVLESFFVFLPLIIIFVLLNLFSSLHKDERRRIIFGFIYALLGLSLFFAGVNTGFMEVGSIIGGYLIFFDSSFLLIAIAFILGVVTILAEPAVYVLTRQIEDVTSGYIKRQLVLTALSLGVGLAVGLSALRVVVVGIELWHYVLPGYFVAILLTFFVPELFIGIAFDAGGVATGPMTATFILAFINGAANEHAKASILFEGFGMIAMVALMPIITLQLLGLFFKYKTYKEGIDSNG